MYSVSSIAYVIVYLFTYFFQGVRGVGRGVMSFESKINALLLIALLDAVLHSSWQRQVDAC